MGVFFRSFGQPLILAYLLSGLLLSFFKVGGQLSSQLELLSRLGISFLLFTAGLQMNWAEIKRIGLAVLRVGFWQVILTTLLGFGLSLALGFSKETAVILGLAFSFSSTIAVVKILADKGELLSLVGRSALGILLWQDLVAVLALTVVAILGSERGVGLFDFGGLFFKGLFLLGLVYFLVQDVLPSLFKKFARSSENLILASVAWCLLVSVLFLKAGFSLEMGAFLAGLSLAATPFSLEIFARIKPLRDFFLALFFMGLGLGVVWDFSAKTLISLAVFGGLILLVKPLVIYLLLKIEGYQKRPAFLTALSLGQASEFSLILVSAAAVNLKLAPGFWPLAAALTIGTIALSSVLINCSKKIYPRVLLVLPEIKKPKVAEQEIDFSFENGAVIFGLHRLGDEFLSLFQKLKIPTIAVDIDPLMVEKSQKLKLRGWNFQTMYGDAGDLEFLEGLSLKGVKFLISTIPDWEDNLILLRFAKKANPHLLIIVTAQQKEEAVLLYHEGAHYVILPHTLSGRAIAHLLGSHLGKPQALLDEGQRHWREISLAK